MIDFTYERATSVGDVVAKLNSLRTAKPIAGGTNLLDLMKEGNERPEHLIDLSHLPLRAIEELPGGSLRIGATATNSEVAYHSLVESRYPLLSKAILAGASAQLRNMATVGGNLLQRTRCAYFYDVNTRCNKREPGEGCSAIGGLNRNHAILGTSRACIATNPSDMSVALAALAAKVTVTGIKGDRTIAFADFHRLPGETPQLDTNLEPGELILHVDLEPPLHSAHSAYVKARERNSYAFALVSCAAALEIDDGKIRSARLALGGVAHKPWRVPEAEELLSGEPIERPDFEGAAARLLEGARGYGHNDFKIPLAKRVIVRALQTALRGEENP